MKFQLPQPVVLTFGETQITYTLTEMVKHFVRSGREFSRSEEDARAGKRILETFERAVATGQVELQPADAKLLRDMAKKPSCGWGRHEVTVQVPAPGANGTMLTREVKRLVSAPAIDYLPLIDALPNG